jgi:predicted amidophosphoribosyltransferase
MQPNSLWVPERIATALVSEGVGKQVAPYLFRSKAVPKAASSSPCERPTAEQHYESITVQGILCKPDEIVLIDDVVTRGATLLGCANRLADAFPQCRIRAFAAMRTISNSNEFENVYSPCAGAIDLVGTGDTFRRP